MLPITKRVMPIHIATNLVGVSPMTGPTGQIHSLRSRFRQTFRMLKVTKIWESPLSEPNTAISNAMADFYDHHSVLYMNCPLDIQLKMADNFKLYIELLIAEYDAVLDWVTPYVGCDITFNTEEGFIAFVLRWTDE